MPYDLFISYSRRNSAQGRITHFIRRIANLRTLYDSFVKPGRIGPVTAVNSVGGLGKTALAVGIKFELIYSELVKTANAELANPSS